MFVIRVVKKYYQDDYQLYCIVIIANSHYHCYCIIAIITGTWEAGGGRVVAT